MFFLGNTVLVMSETSQVRDENKLISKKSAKKSTSPKKKSLESRKNKKKSEIKKESSEKDHSPKEKPRKISKSLKKSIDIGEDLFCNNCGKKIEIEKTNEYEIIDREIKFKSSPAKSKHTILCGKCREDPSVKNVLELLNTV